MRKRTAVLIAGLVIMALIFAAIQNIGFKYTDKKVATPSPTPTVSSFPMTLSIFPNVINIQSGSQGSADIILDTQGIRPSLVQLEIAYDPLILTGLNITPGDLTQNNQVTLNNINYQTGRISYAIQFSEQKLPTTKGSIARLNFLARTDTLSTKSSIYFLPKTAIQVIGGANGLSAAYGSTIIILPVTTPPAEAVRGLPKR